MMQPDAVVIASKKTPMDYYQEEYDDVAEALPEDEYEAVKEGFEDHYGTLDELESVLEDDGIEYDFVTVFPGMDAPERSFDSYDAVVSLGGDGTMLQTAKYVEDAPVLPIKSSPDSTGAMYEYGPAEADAAVDALLEDDLNEAAWTRLEGEFDGETEYALNDVFVGAERSFKAAEYEIELGDDQERHKNSGMIVSTGRGSTGWYKNILKQRLQTGVGWIDTRLSSLYERIADTLYTFDPEDDVLKSVEREPMQNAGDALTQCTIGPDEELTLTSKMNVEGVITFDGDEEDRMYDFPRGASVTFRVADAPLRVLRRT